MAEAVLHWESSLGQFHRVWLNDGRVVAGRLACIDYLKNLILHQCIELRPSQSPEIPPDLDPAQLSSKILELCQDFFLKKYLI
jgi:small nuclear ribonucleoprotein (snRNP)-like protein